MTSTNPIPIQTNKSLNKTDFNVLHHPKIQPIRKYKAQLDQNIVKKQIAKKIISRKWEYISHDFGRPEVELKKLCRALKTSKICSSLDLQFDKWHLLNGHMRLLGQSLRRLALLEDLSLIFSLHEGNPVSGSQDMNKRLKSLKCLKSFKTLNGNVESLSQAFKYLASLKEISLSDNCGLLSRDSLTMESLDRGLKKVKLLENLALYLGCLRNASDFSVQNLAQCLSKLPILKSLELDLNEFSQDKFEAFAESIGRLVSLEKLNVNLRRNEIVDQDLEKLGEALQKLDFLSDLNLNFSTCRSLTETGYKAFSQSLQQISSLKRINLESQVTEALASETLDHISQFLPKMSHITLHFTSCDSFTDAGIQSLSQGLKNATSLEYLDLNFGCANWLTETGFEALFESLQYLAPLKTLNLAFDAWNGPKGNGFQPIGKSFENLHNLTDLRFSCFNSYSFSDDQLKCLSEGLKRRDTIKNLYLNFKFCIGITDEGLESLAEGLKGLGNLSSIFLDLERCQEMTDRGLESLGKALSQISGLQSLDINLDAWSPGQLTSQGIKAFLKSLEQLNCLQNLSLLTKHCEEWNEYIASAEALKMRFPTASISIQSILTFSAPAIIL